MIFLSKIVCFGVAIVAANTILQPYPLFMLQKPNYVNRLAFKPISLFMPFTHNLKREPDVSMLNKLQIAMNRNRLTDLKINRRKYSQGFSENGNLFSPRHHQHTYWNAALFTSNNPCITTECPGLNTYCIARSPFRRSCICIKNNVPINGNAGLFGCKPINPSQLGSSSQTEQGGETDSCDVKQCGTNSFCIVKGTVASCHCDTGFFLTEDNGSEYCTDPCTTNNPCTVTQSNSCIGLSANLAICFCIGLTRPLDGAFPANGCSEVSQENTNTACSMNENCDGGFTCDTNQSQCVCGADKVIDNQGRCITPDCTAIDSSSCVNGFTCDDGETYTCICASGAVTTAGNCLNSDPCETMCLGPDIVCIINSEVDTECQCKIGTIPTNPDEPSDGCIADPCLSKNCGANSFCDIESGIAECVCHPGFFETADGCIDPCTDSNPCMIEMNTDCLPLSATQATCVCTGKNVPIKGSASMFGCGDQNDCNIKSCGPNSYCILRGDTPTCICEKGYFVATDENIVGDGCKNPCDDTPCLAMMNSECLSITATKFDCICPSGTRPSDGVNPDNGCEIYCNYQGFEIDNDGDTITAPDGASVQCIGGELTVVTPSTFVPNYAMMCNVAGFTAVEGGCYHASTDTVSSADDARDACLGMGGDLAGPPDINDGESYAAVLTALRDEAGAATNVEYWIGIQQSSGAEPFYQVYPNPKFILFPLDSPLWEDGQPNGDTTATGSNQQNCARLIDNKVQDKGCTGGTHPYLCVIPNVSTK